MAAYLSGIRVFTPEVRRDNRGFFFQSYDEKVAEYIDEIFVQDNHSYSHKNVIRGMHYQWEQPMGKLVRAVHGSAMDYLVDIRKESPTFGQFSSILISAENNKMVWIPPGFAHGFESLEDDTIILYKCTSYYNKKGESGINPFDESINIPWLTLRNKMIVSDKDLASQMFIDYSLDPKF